MDGDRLDDSEVSLVLRRAAELDNQRVPGREVDLAAVEDAAAEVGLSRDAVRQAVAELRAGALGGARNRPGGRVLGPPTLTVVRTVPGPASEVRSWVHDFLAGQLFCLRRDRDGRSLWERRDDVAAKVRRGVDALREHRLVLPDVHRIEAVVVAGPGGGDLAVVRLELDVRHARRSQAAMVASGGVVGAAVVGGTLLAAGLDPALLFTAPLGGGVAAAGHGVGSRLYRRQVGELSLAAEGVLDRLESRTPVGRPLTGPLGPGRPLTGPLGP